MVYTQEEIERAMKDLGQARMRVHSLEAEVSNWTRTHSAMVDRQGELLKTIQAREADRTREQDLKEQYRHLADSRSAAIAGLEASFKAAVQAERERTEQLSTVAEESLAKDAVISAQAAKLKEVEDGESR